MSQPEDAEPVPAPAPADEARPELAKGTRQERRARRKKKAQERMPQHGKGLAQMYKDAVEKRATPKKP